MDSLSQGGTAGLVPLVLTTCLVVLVGEEAPQRDTDVGELQLGEFVEILEFKTSQPPNPQC